MNRLKALRQEKGLSQQALGDKVGASYRTIQNWENGVNSIKPDKAQKLADFFGVPVAYLLNFTDERDSGIDDGNNDELIDMGREYARLYLRDKSLEQFESLIERQSDIAKISKEDEAGLFVQVDPSYIVHERITDVYTLLALSPREYQEIILAWSCLSYDEQRKILDMLNKIIVEKFE
ncbi:helix-turn-helix transcriptional regulator [Streptococcus suis]|uniref:helix-turn-helix domain-containing protein n=1 Tax=Streptococcus suis TaxID=1307 RepID=UPI0006973A3B|nr:helix-turn-helix transcriptional regulator [Streptococcus suis]MCK4004403.1 helix-turn-helix transcriptional regulator [Streptococcus suis]NQG46697.1 helix-turn-helix transcriptional regulator [Streptococcus suis]NQJ90275.1 helix-turn-helix transcriptional regulator [Streptococcus suis]NQL58086.1 helix-turn-helix transcriptional regulator [Streptococcus suis]NQL92218.1 helix-turn-helix transcriptional regulator [Streptococcus suis]